MGQGAFSTSPEVEGRTSDHLPDGNTPLDEDEAAELIPTHLTTRGQLNAWEQANINLATEWLRLWRPPATVLQVDFVKELHRRMFNDTWRWAGTFRTTLKSIGVEPHLITEALI